MKRVKYLKSLLFVIAMLSILSLQDVCAQDEGGDDLLPCLQSEYTQKDRKVSLDCKPDDAKYLNYNKIEWAVFKIRNKGEYGNEIHNAVSGRGNKFFLHPNEIFNSVGEEEVAVRFFMHDGEGRGYQVYYKVKVRASN